MHSRYCTRCQTDFDWTRAAAFGKPAVPERVLEKGHQQATTQNPIATTVRLRHRNRRKGARRAGLVKPTSYGPCSSTRMRIPFSRKLNSLSQAEDLYPETEARGILLSQMHNAGRAQARGSLLVRANHIHTFLFSCRNSTVTHYAFQIFLQKL